MHIVQFVEIAIILLTLLSLLSTLFPWMPPPAPLILVGIAALLLVVHFTLFPFRWQMVPAALVIITLVMGIFFSWEPGPVLSIVGYGVGTLSLLLSVTLSFGFPVRNLPEPDGPNRVGVTSLLRAYNPDPMTSESEAAERRLLLKIWYPATVEQSNGFERETLWSEMNNPHYFSPLERLFTSYLKSMTTSSYKDAPIATADGDRQVIIYNHALLSTASENTLLMEALASHGYIVISVQHEDQRSEYAVFQKNTAPEELIKEAASLKKLGTATHLSRAERSALALQVYSANITLTEIVKHRAADSKHVLDHLVQILAAIPRETKEISFDQNKVAFVGLSLGGAVATELCKMDQRCSAVVNLDGGIFGTNIHVPTGRPYLMLYSERNNGGNDFLKNASGNTFEDHMIAGADHMNFHDASFVLPGLKWIGLLGNIEGAKMIEERNQRVIDYLSEVF